MEPKPGSSCSVGTITVSDSRTDADDASGKLLRERLEGAGFKLSPHKIVRDDAKEIQAAVRGAIAAGVQALVLSGGTGIGPRDVTVEALEPLFVRKLEGFGEAFRRLSWEQVGARAVLSRATAGTVGSSLVFALPGSPKAVALGVEQLIIPLVEHALHMIEGAGHHAAHS